MTKRELRQAAALLLESNGLLITAGAGMGVDSGLPDFRGPQGFWQAYPALGRAGLQFEDIANPDSFRSDPHLAWGFYGHRLNLYRATEPHAGFRILHELGDRLDQGTFVFTSNVDGQFQKAGFDEDQIVECHGSIHHLQCLDACTDAIWSAGVRPEIDERECRMRSRLPECPLCRTIARPNILMFGDAGWVATRAYEQQARFRRWRQRVARLVVIEIGAGTAIPTARLFGERQECPLIRINPDEAEVSRATDVSLPMGALAALAGVLEEFRELSGC